MAIRNFQLVDVFAEQAFRGNPLPVFLDARDISSEEMLKITRWMNQSETAFLLPPGDERADYQVRIFTPDRELPFAGHPTLGSCHAWLTAGGRPKSSGEITQECGIGLVTIKWIDSKLAFAAPELIRSGPVDEKDLERITRVLQIDRKAIVDAQWADNGPGWVVVLLESAQAVLDINPLAWFPVGVDIGIVGPCEEGADTAFELRALFSDQHGSIREDPVTGSLNASVAQYLYTTGRATGPYTASQGACIGRAGRIEISRDDNGNVWVGGHTQTLVEGIFPG